MDVKNSLMALTGERSEARGQLRSAGSRSHEFGSAFKKAQNGMPEQKLREKPATKETSLQKEAFEKESSVAQKSISKKDAISTDKSNKETADQTDLEDVLKKISENMDIPIEEIQKIMMQLQITPIDLLDINQLQDFVQTMLKIEDSSDLLWIPNIQKVFKDVQDIGTVYEQSLTVEMEIPVEAVAGLQEKEIALFEQLENTDVKNENVFPAFEGSGIPEENAEVMKEEPVQSFSRVVVEEESLQMEEPINSVDGDIGLYQVFTGEVNNSVSVASEGQAAPPIKMEQLIEQVVDQIKVEVKQDVTEMKLLLKPEHLGDLSLRLITERGIVTAQFIAESQQVKEIIEASFNQLKNVLQEQGISIQQMSVSVGSQEQGQRQNERQFAQQSKSRKRIEQIMESIRQEEMPSGYENPRANPYEQSENQVNYRA